MKLSIETSTAINELNIVIKQENYDIVFTITCGNSNVIECTIEFFSSDVGIMNVRCFADE